MPSLGPYELLGLLGRGGMAEVYLARRRSGSVEKRLVVKRVRRERVGDARALAMLVREARLSMSLAHQNVVTVFDFGRVGDDVFLAMEYVEGRDLGSTLARPGAGPMPPLCAAHVAAQCGLALDHAHRRRDAEGHALEIVHRDVTPRNLLVSESGEVKLADFGVAGLAGDPAGGVRGTPAYMAPEQARGEPVDARADLYALGLVLWEMLAGRRARAATGAEQVLALARAGTPPPVLPDAPAALTHVIARATAADRDDRYASARELLADLDAYLVAARAAAPGPTPADQLAAWYARAWAGAPPALAALPAGTPAMLDEGATLRSMAETAAGEAAPIAGEAAPIEAGAGAAPIEAGAEAAPIAGEAAPSAVAAAVAGATRWAAWRWGAGAAVVLVVAVVAIWPRPRAPVTRAPVSPAATTAAATSPPATQAASAPASAPDLPAARAPAPSSPPAAPAVAAPAVAAPAVAAPAPAVAAPSAPGKPVRHPPPPRAAASPTTTIAAVPATPVAPRAVTIGAQPWAHFTIDDDPTEHQTPETVHLDPGPHRIRFYNPALGLAREIRLEVPADRDLRHLERLQ